MVGTLMIRHSGNSLSGGFSGALFVQSCDCMAIESQDSLRLDLEEVLAAVLELQMRFGHMAMRSTRFVKST